MAEKEKSIPQSIEELGEFGLINHLARHVTLYNPSTVKGIGDDAAVISYGEKTAVLSSDMLLEGIHFDLVYMPLKHLGYKAVVVNLSDIFAMNAKPRQITVSLALSSKFTLDAVEELYAGMLMACKKYQVDMVGGDTSTSKQGLIISITCLGEAAPADIVYRSTAKTTDLLCVSGDLGAAYMGYQLLEREKRVFMETPGTQPDLAGHEYILERQLKPEAREDIYELLKTLQVKPTSMIDISDGLSSEILHLCKQSGVGMRLFEEKIPIDPTTHSMALEFNLDPVMCALSGGEDYELLFTIAQADYDKVKNQPDISIIGHCTEPAEGAYLITKAGNAHELKAQGWKHFG